jgi:hypothetical protein
LIRTHKPQQFDGCHWRHGTVKKSRHLTHRIRGLWESSFKFKQLREPSFGVGGALPSGARKIIGEQGIESDRGRQQSAEQDLLLSGWRKEAPREMARAVPRRGPRRKLVDLKGCRSAWKLGET